MIKIIVSCSLNAHSLKQRESNIKVYMSCSVKIKLICIFKKSSFHQSCVISLSAENVEVPESKPAGVYRPPGARLTTTKRAHNQGPPEIFSDTQFPSLSATAKHVETRK